MTLAAGEASVFHAIAGELFETTTHPGRTTFPPLPLPPVGLGNPGSESLTG